MHKEGIMKGRVYEGGMHYERESLCIRKALWKGEFMHEEDIMKGGVYAWGMHYEIDSLSTRPLWKGEFKYTEGIMKGNEESIMNGRVVSGT